MKSEFQAKFLPDREVKVVNSIFCYSLPKLGEPLWPKRSKQRPTPSAAHTSSILQGVTIFHKVVQDSIHKIRRYIYFLLYLENKSFSAQLKPWCTELAKASNINGSNINLIYWQMVNNQQIKGLQISFPSIMFTSSGNYMFLSVQTN